ncbi:MAG: hypothetical protein EHM45_07355 [Desulfobacteraceae bacterium]|nr:MAG: hypothetical protein EHM45_07355 [Desulfobacteraceae bacterium]
MNKSFHGIASLGLAGIAMAVAAVSLFRISWIWGAVYLAVCAAGCAAILHAYCAKCPCRARCGHVFPWQVARFFKNRPSGPYSAFELIVTGAALLLLIGFPQIWLWRHFAAFILFWALTAVAVMQVRFVVCRACDNGYCPANKKKQINP